MCSNNIVDTIIAQISYVFVKHFVGHVVAVHLDTSRPADDEKISHLLNLTEINIEDQFEMRGCSILQWQSQVEGIEEIPLDSNVTILCTLYMHPLFTFSHFSSFHTVSKFACERYAVLTPEKPMKGGAIWPLPPLIS